MAETLISPGVLARENDQSFITQQPITVGAAIIGPTVKGPVEVPTVVTSYSDYENKFGTGFLSGSQVYTYFTSIAAYNYFANGGETLLVARVTTGSFTEATTVTGPTGSNGVVNSTPLTTASITLSTTALSPFVNPTGSFVINGVTIAVTGSPAPANTATTIFVASGSTSSGSIANIVAAFNASASVAPYSASLQYITASVSGSNAGIFLNSTSGVSGVAANSYYVTSGSTTTFFSGGTNTPALVLATLSEGALMNDTGSEDISGSLASGSSDNIRWQIANSDTAQGTFSLIIRQGNDNTDNPIVLETWTNLSMDPTLPNFITKVIGDQKKNYNSAINQIEVSGSVPNFSRYVRVKSVATPTPLYFDNTGNAKAQYTASIPVDGSGSFANATGDLYVSSYAGGTGAAYYENITSVSNIQGLNTGSYNNMIALLSNQDDYRFNALIAPGLFNSIHPTQTTNIINNTQNRGDSIFVLDLVPYNVSSISSVTAQANSRNTSYAASYWPWVQTPDPNTGALVWVPASTMVAGVYAYNDSVSEPWFAPAGINRGGLSTVVRAAQKLSQTQRDNLYVNKVNPIATFPGTGVVVYGQKTLQTKASALDRVNVRRLLIAVKSYISQIANNLVFEQNTIATRNAFLAQVNPYLTSVQQRQGLYAFKVIMDDSNNTPDVIDRNQLVGQIYLQPTKTAEFIYLNFNVLPTGVTFPA
jgi:phage tail sheath protein FI